MRNQNRPFSHRIRQAEPGDFVPITEIYQAAVLQGTGSFEIEPPDVEEMLRRHDTVVAQNGIWYVAESGDSSGRQISGFAYAAPFHHRAAYRYVLENSVYVSENFQRRGIGILLLRRLIDEAHSKSYRHMIAVIGDSDNAGSIGPHRVLGFEHVGKLSEIGFKHNRWLDVIYMQKRLGRNAR